jgi:tRNA U38,U39,U40 pseudouridine synthase TruA
MASALSAAMVNTLFGSHDFDNYTKSEDDTSSHKETIVRYVAPFVENKGVFTKEESKQTLKAGHIFSTSTRRR